MKTPLYLMTFVVAIGLGQLVASEPVSAGTVCNYGCSFNAWCEISAQGYSCTISGSGNIRYCNATPGGCSGGGGSKTVPPPYNQGFAIQAPETLFEGTLAVPSLLLAQGAAAPMSFSRTVSAGSPTVWPTVFETSAEPETLTACEARREKAGLRVAQIQCEVANGSAISACEAEGKG